MVFATLREPPQKGSVREFVITLFLLRRHQIEHAKVRALAQIAIDKDAGMKAFEDYMRVAFPYAEVAKKRDSQEVREFLLKEVSRGPLTGIVPLSPEGGKSRLRTKVLTVAEAKKAEWGPKMNRVLQKVGRVIPKGEV